MFIYMASTSPRVCFVMEICLINDQTGHEQYRHVYKHASPAKKIFRSALASLHEHVQKWQHIIRNNVYL